MTNGTPDYNKVEVCGHGKGHRLRIRLNSREYGDIWLYSDHYDSLREADSRAFVVARQLGLDRDSLPVHPGANGPLDDVEKPKVPSE